MHAKEILFRDLLPVPPINELGRAYGLGRLRDKIGRPFGQWQSCYRSELLRDWYAYPECRAVYRNYLDVGSFGSRSGGTPDPFDRTAYNVMTRRIEDNVHWRYETRIDADDWLVEESFRCTLTPPFLGLPVEGA